VQEQTQANQSLAHMMGNQKRARMQVGEMLVAMIVQDIGSSQHAVVIEGDNVTPVRIVVLSKPEADPLTGVPYLSNDLQRTMLQVGPQDVPSSPTYRGQQLNALSESIKSLPPQYQAAAMPFPASLMDVPFKRALHPDAGADVGHEHQGPLHPGQGPALVVPEAQEEAAAAPPVRENTSPSFPARAGGEGQLHGRHRDCSTVR
jgi:hypothetical protein